MEGPASLSGIISSRCGEPHYWRKAEQTCVRQRREAPPRLVALPQPSATTLLASRIDFRLAWSQWHATVTYLLVLGLIGLLVIRLLVVSFFILILFLVLVFGLLALFLLLALALLVLLLHLLHLFFHFLLLLGINSGLIDDGRAETPVLEVARTNKEEVLSRGWVRHAFLVTSHRKGHDLQLSSQGEGAPPEMEE